MLARSLVSPSFAASLANAVFLDASWHLNDPLKGAQDFARAHIPRARFFDLDKHSDPLSSFPHMLPSPLQFKATMEELGCSKNDTIIVYDQGMFSAPRYRALGLPIESGNPIIAKSEYSMPTLNRKMVLSYMELLQKIGKFADIDFTIVDARSKERFAGTVPEPRPIPSGHMPSSVNLPYGKLITDANTLISKQELIDLLKSERIDYNRPIISSCGSGVTACILGLALDSSGLKKIEDFIVYDGSWAEYASYKNSPIANYRIN